MADIDEINLTDLEEHARKVADEIKRLESDVSSWYVISLIQNRAGEFVPHILAEVIAPSEDVALAIAKEKYGFYADEVRKV